MNVAKDQIEFKDLILPPSSSSPPPRHHLPLLLSLSQRKKKKKFNKICKLYIKRLLSAALNSSLNGFSPGEEIFSKKPRRRERGHYCFNPLTSSHFKTFFWRVKWRLVYPILTQIPRGRGAAGGGGGAPKPASLHLTRVFPTEHAVKPRQEENKIKARN